MSVTSLMFTNNGRINIKSFTKFYEVLRIEWYVFSGVDGLDDLIVKRRRTFF